MMKNAIDPVAFYAAIISTITLIWSIGNAILEKKSKINVDIKINSKFIIMSDNSLVDAPKSITISIVNKGYRSKYIKSINLKFPFKTSMGDNEVTQQNLKMTYPIEIKPECEYIETIYPDESWNWVLSKYRNGVVRAVVYDTTNKKYKSNRIWAKRIKEIYEFNSKVDSWIWNVIDKE